jgi:tetratricopeptide (TPR) repeat protein
MRVRTILSIYIAVLTVGFTQATLAAGGGGGGAMPQQMDMPRQSPEDIARQDYNTGISYVKDAAKQEGKLTEAKDAKQADKTREKIAKAYTNALKNFTRAAQRVPNMPDAWNYIGFTQRHLGDYQASLAAYAKALELKPNFPEAIEYRGEAFLGLNAIDDAKQAYLSLYRSSRPLSDQLLTAMKAWVAKRKQDAGGVDSTTVEAFSAWVSERAAMAGQTASTVGEAPARW